MKKILNESETPVNSAGGGGVDGIGIGAKGEPGRRKNYDNLLLTIKQVLKRRMPLG